MKDRKRERNEERTKGKVGLERESRNKRRRVKVTKPKKKERERDRRGDVYTIFRTRKSWTAYVRKAQAENRNTQRQGKKRVGEQIKRKLVHAMANDHKKSCTVKQTNPQPKSLHKLNQN